MQIVTPDPADQAAAMRRVAEHADLAARVGPCARPVRLPGHRTGRGVGEDREPRMVRCHDRRRAVCASCSALYRADALHLLSAGLAGGKDTPESVAARPRVFVTLTAPSFGTVHLGPHHGQLHHCHPRRGCGLWHLPGDAVIGTPLDPQTYDHVGQVLFNAHAGQLWAAFATATRRALAAQAGLSRAQARRQVRVVFAKVAEFQARGVVHVHAVIRLDPTEHPAPPWANVGALTACVRLAARTARVTTPVSAVAASRRLRWGRKLDIAPITTRPGAASVTAVAGYIAKYATKATEPAGLRVGPIHCPACDGQAAIRINSTPLRVRLCRDCHGTGRRPHADLGQLTGHARALVQTCWRLGPRPEFAHLHLRRHAHQAGFRGHFLTKSQTWSTTFTALRAERHAYAQTLTAPTEPAPGSASGRSSPSDCS